MFCFCLRFFEIKSWKLVLLTGFEPVKIGKIAEAAANASKGPELDEEKREETGNHHHGSAFVFVTG